MAKQMGILPIEGTIGNINFFKSADGYMVRTKGGVSADKIATDPAFQRTRENMAEFGRAGKGGKLLRNSLRGTILNARDARLVSRLTTRMLKVVKADVINERGLRNVIDGEAGLLAGFEFNINAPLSATLAEPYTVTFTRTSGSAQVNIKSFIPLNMVAAPPGTTHFQVFAAATSIDFEVTTYEVDTAMSGTLQYNNTPTSVIALSMSLGANSPHPVFIALGVEFLQQVNGNMYSLNNGAFNACSIIKVDNPV